MFKRAKNFFGKANKKVATMCMMLFAMFVAALPASAAPSTGNTDIDAILTEMDSGYGVVNKGFVFLAIGAVAITLVVVAFFWLRGKFKQAVSGA